MLVIFVPRALLLGWCQVMSLTMMTAWCPWQWWLPHSAFWLFLWFICTGGCWITTIRKRYQYLALKLSSFLSLGTSLTEGRISDRLFMTQASYLVVPRAIPSKIKRNCHLERDIKIAFCFNTSQMFIHLLYNPDQYPRCQSNCNLALDNGRKTDDRYCQLTDFGKLIADIVRFLILSLETYVFNSSIILCSLA